MVTRILKLDNEDVELIEKLVTNINRRLMQDASHPVYSAYLLTVHRLLQQIQEGLPTENEYIRSLSDAKAAFSEAATKEKERKYKARERKLQRSGITAHVETIEAEEPIPEPKRTKVRKKRSATPIKKSTSPAKKKAAKMPPQPAKVGPCHIHQNSGARSPRSECEGCWDYYRELHPDRYEAAWQKFTNKT